MKKQLFFSTRLRYFFLSLALGILALFPDIACADDVGELVSRSETSSMSVIGEASRLIDTLRNGTHQELAPTTGRGASVSSPSGLKGQYPEQGRLNDTPLVHEEKGKCKDNASRGLGKCPSTLWGVLQNLEGKKGIKARPNTRLFIFVSESVPMDSIKELWSQAQRVGGKLVFRGLVEGSFKKTRAYIQDLGIVADIDPTKFEEFGVNQAPAFVLSKGDKHDQMVGNISLKEFLEQTSQRGELKEEARSFLEKLQGEKP